MCLYPKLIINKKYTETKKNNYNPPELKDERIKYVPVACGKCIECMKAKKREWATRLKEEIKETKNGKFITLTFSNESILKLKKDIIESNSYYIESNQIATLAVRRFLERWRKNFKTSVKHWLITELGHQGTERIHLHGLLFTNEKDKKIQEIWKYGYIYVGKYVNQQTINYISKYINKTDFQHKNYKPKILCSKGIGRGYIQKKENIKFNQYKENETKETYTDEKGYKTGLPTYYRNHIYSEEEKEKLWIEKIEKKTRYICGEKIDISTEEGEKKFEELQKYYRNMNKRLGYGNDEATYDEKEYRRILDLINLNKYKNKSKIKINKK